MRPPEMKAVPAPRKDSPTTNPNPGKANAGTSRPGLPRAAAGPLAPPPQPQPNTTSSIRPPAPNARRSQATRLGERSSKQGEGLKGTSQSMPLLSVFQFLGRMRKTGTMRVQLPGELLSFQLDNGCVQFTTTDKCPADELLGELLVEQGACTHEELEPIIAMSDAGSPDRFGQLTIQEGVANNGQVLAALELQVRRRFARACKSMESVYEFLEGVCESSEGRLRIQPMALA
jgi:hypothetical protein